MDAAMRGQPYVKSALDMACWDAAARLHGRPLCEALGGRFGEAVDLYRSLSPGPAEAVVARAQACLDAGYRRLQVKVGGDPDADAARLAAVRDAVGAGGRALRRRQRRLDDRRRAPLPARDGGPRLHARAAVRVDRGVRGAAAALPAPAGAGRVDRRRSRALLRARRDGVADGVTIKIARVGGVTRAAALRDVAVELGLTVTVEDTGGATIDTAAMLHLSLSTPEPHRAHTVDFTDWVTVANADGLPAARGRPPGGAGRRPASASPCGRSRSASRSCGRRDRAAPARREPHARGRGRRGGARPPGAAGDAARARIARGRDVTDALLARGERVYGLTTGVGALKRVAVGARRAARVQPPDAALAPHRHRPRRRRAGRARGDAGAGGRVRPRPLGRRVRSWPTTCRRAERRPRAAGAHDRLAGPVRSRPAGRPRGRAHRRRRLGGRARPAGPRRRGSRPPRRRSRS